MMRFFALLILLSLAVYAATPIETCTLIDAPGEYFLANDLENASPTVFGVPENCIRITSSDVTLDCRGHLINNTYALGEYGIWVSAPDESVVRRVVVHDCSVTRYELALFLTGVEDSAFTNISGTGAIYLSGSNQNLLQRIVRNGSIVLADFSSGNSIKDSILIGYFSGGYIIQSGDGNTLINDTALERGPGFHISSSGTVVRDSYASDCLVGFQVDGTDNKFFNCTATRSSIGLLVNNNASNNEFDGFYSLNNSEYNLQILNSENAHFLNSIFCSSGDENVRDIDEFMRVRGTQFSNVTCDTGHSKQPCDHPCADSTSPVCLPVYILIFSLVGLLAISDRNIFHRN